MRQELFKDHINFLKQKLNRANGILAKLRHQLAFWYPKNSIPHTTWLHVRLGDKATVTY